jgi:membrane protein implicated in regulation of membrane protease activity
MFLLLALVLLVVLPSPWGFVGFGIALVCFGGEVLFWQRRVRGRRAVVGAHTLIGEVGTVVSACRPTGQVRVSGEIWAAQCELGAGAGETVTVVGRSNLTLIVESTSRKSDNSTDVPAGD